MKKETVMERYEKQQVMMGEMAFNKMDVACESGTQSLQLPFKQLEQALYQAHQAIKQAQSIKSIQKQLEYADNRLQFSIQQLQQFALSVPNVTHGLPVGTQQQITQLEHQIQQANQTLLLIQSSISSQ